MEPVKTAEPRAPHSGEWEELRRHLRHQAVEVLRLIAILLQDAVILLAGFLAEFAYEHWLHSEHPFFQFAISISSAVFLLLYVVTVTVHVVNYVRGQFGTTSASVLGQDLPWALAAGGVIAAAVAVAVPSLHQQSGASPRADALEMRTEIDTPSTTDPISFALSPDGRQIVFVASGGGSSRLWLRALATAASQPLAGTEGARFPFWSPDSRSVGFFAENKLKRLDLGGGAPQTLASAGAPRGGTWNAAGVILFAPSTFSGLFRVAASGGEAVAVTKLDRQSTHRWPTFLPDGRHFLFIAQGASDRAGIDLGALDAGDTTRLTANDTAGVYLPSGWLLWVRAGTLVAERLDLARHALVGDPVTVATPVAFDPQASAGAVSVSTTGLVAYRAGANRRQLTWVDRAGKDLGTLGAPDDKALSAPRLSPDGGRVAGHRVIQGNTDIWLMDSARMSRFTFDAALDRVPVWSPDGRRIVFDSDRTGPRNLYMKLSGGASQEELLLDSPQNKIMNDWSADGRFLLYQSVDPQSSWDLWVLPLEGDRKPWVFLKTPFDERQGAFSPDGRWVAYMSNESGREEIYVRPFVSPATSAPRDGVTGDRPGGQWQVSTAGGIYSCWRPDGKELYYLGPDGRMMAAPIAVTATTIMPGTPVALFQTHIYGGGVNSGQGRQYDFTRDGRFLINTALDDVAAPITLLQNWNPDAKK